MKAYFTWDDIHELVNIINSHIPDNIEFIHGLSRGGLIPAVMLSHVSGIKYTNDINLFSKENTLIIDDIADSGETLKKWQGYTTATLVYKPHTSIIKPDIFASEHAGDEWIVFPWELEESQTIQDYKLDERN